MRNFLKGMDAIRKWIILILIVVIGLWLWHAFSTIPALSTWFKEGPVRIDETPLLITEVKKIAELHTAKLYCEVITDSVVTSGTGSAFNAISKTRLLPIMIPGSLFGEKKIVMIVKGQITAGIDFGEIEESRMRIKDDSVWLTIPRARIIDIVVNPSDTEIFLEDGSWSSTEQIAVKQKAIMIMRREAEAKQLIQQAETKAVLLMRDFLLSTGFSFVEVKIK